MPFLSIDFSAYGFEGLVVASLLALIAWLIRDLRAARRELLNISNEHRDLLLGVIEANTRSNQKLCDLIQERIPPAR